MKHVRPRGCRSGSLLEYVFGMNAYLKGHRDLVSRFMIRTIIFLGVVYDL